MDQNLTQPEELDQILSAMASRISGRSLETVTPLSNGYQPNRITQNTKCDTDTEASNYSSGTVIAKSTHGFGESYPYVWSM